MSNGKDGISLANEQIPATTPPMNAQSILMEKEWLTVADVCQLLTIKKKTVYNWTLEGKIVVTKLYGSKGGPTRIHRKEIKKILGIK